MGFDFYNDSREYLGLTRLRWLQIYELAVANGWKPKGTVANRAMIRYQWADSPLSDEEVEVEVERTAAAWSGSYFFNEYQILEADDAAALADALQQALSCMEPHSAEDPLDLDDEPTVDWSYPHVIDELKPPSHKLLQACIAFFRRGRFRMG